MASDSETAVYASWRSREKDDMPVRLLVKRRWTDSNLVIKPVFKVGDTGEQYSTNWRAYTLKALTSDEVS